MQFLTAEDAFHRLCGNVLKIGDRYVVVTRIFVDDDGNTRGSYRDIETGVVTHFDPNSKYIQPPKFSLGYMNFHQDRVLSPVWVERLPLRHRSLGLTTRNCTMYSHDRESRIPFGLPTFYRSDFLKMLKGEYPHVSQGIKAKENFAFSKDFALYKISLESYALYHRCNKVGEFNGKNFTLYSAFEYLHEQLLEAIEPKGEKYDIAVVQTEAGS